MRAKAEQNARATLRLALPAMGSRAGILLMLTTDALMVGHTGQDQLAYLGAAFAIQGLLMLISIGFLQGTMVLIAQAFGAGEFDFCGEVWRVALIIAVSLGTLAFGVSLFGAPLFHMLGQPPMIAEGGGEVLAQFGWGLPAMMLYIACAYFLEGIQRPRIAMIIMAGAVILNTGLNAVFIYALDGGAPGAAAATSITRWVIFFIILAYITLIMGDRATFGVRALGCANREAVLRVWRYVKRAVRLGAPMGLTQGAETAAFAAITLTAGLFGEAALAAHTITMQLVQLVFMLAIGMAAATAVRVGYAVGNNDKTGVQWVAWTGAGLISMIMVPFVVALFAFPMAAASLFTTAPEALAIARITIKIAAVMLIFDSLMTVMQGALRGAGDVWVPMMLHLFAMWLVMVPIARYLALEREWGVPGLFIGLFVGIVVAAALATGRFLIISRRDVIRA